MEFLLIPAKSREIVWWAISSSYNRCRTYFGRRLLWRL